MTPLQDRILHLIRRESLVPTGARVVAALSGGADSVALTLLLRELARTGGFELAGIAHLNHNLRPTADGDQQFCCDLAAQLSLPIEVGSADVRGRSTRERISIEEAGHRERYVFFRRALNAFAADRVATAHTRHDQAETSLMRFLRGAGPGGLSGIHPRSGRVIRPLIDVSRTELRTFLASRGQTYREDETNQDLRVTRNRIRHELIPFLQSRFSASVVETLARDAKIARYDAEWLDAEANRAALTIVKEIEGGVELDRAALVGQPVALARRVAKQAVERVSGRASAFDQVERVLALADAGTSDPEVIDLQGCHVRRFETRLVVRSPRPRNRAPEPDGFAYCLRIPGEVAVREAGVFVSVERATVGTPIGTLAARGGRVCVAGDQLTDPLIVRNWRPGDVIRPLGLRGHKKLQDFFVDRKIAREARQEVPIVTDKHKGIVWIVRHTVGDDFRVSANTEGMLILKVRDFGGAE